MSKSHVSLEQKLCLVTGQPYDSGAILLDKRLKESLEKHTLTGWGICPEVQEKFDEGYVALVGVDAEKSTIINEKITPENAWRTGNIAYIRRSVIAAIMTGFPEELSWTFVEEEVFAKLKEMQENATEE